MGTNVGEGNVAVLDTARWVFWHRRRFVFLPKQRVEWKVCQSSTAYGFTWAVRDTWCFVPMEEKQVYHDVVSPLMPEFFTSSTDFYLPQGELHGKRQITNQQKAQYLLNVTLRDLFLSEVLIHKYQCREIAHAPIEQFIWHSWVSLVQVEQTTMKNSHGGDERTLKATYTSTKTGAHTHGSCPRSCQALRLWLSASQLHKMWNHPFPSAFCLADGFSLLCSSQCTHTSRLDFRASAGKATWGGNLG